MTLPRVLKPASSWLPLQIPIISLCFVGSTAYWIFPYRLYQGGAAFLLMYVIMLIAMMAPVMYMGIRLGGTTQRGLLAMQAKYLSGSTGIGLALFIRLIILALVMGANACLPLWYMFVAGDTKPGSPYPWTTCSNPWNTNACDPTFDVYDPKTDSHVQPELEYYRYLIMEPRPLLPDIGQVIPPLAGMLAVLWTFTFLLACWGPRLFGWLVLIFGGLFLLGVLALLSICYSQFDKGAATNGLDIFSPDFSSFIGLSWNAFVTASSTTAAWSYMLPTVGKFAGKEPGSSTVLLVFALITGTVIPVLIATLLGSFYGVFSEVHKMSDLYGFDFAYGRELTVFFIPVASRYLELHPAITFMLFGSQVILVALAQGLIVLVLVDSILEGMYSRWLEAIKANRAMWRLLVTAAVCALSLLLSLPLVTQNGTHLLDKASLSLQRLDFVYFLPMAVSLLIINGQQKQVHNTLLCCAGFTTGVSAFMRPGALFLFLIAQGSGDVTPYLDGSTALFSLAPLMIGVPVGVLYAYRKRTSRQFTSLRQSPPASAPRNNPMTEVRFDSLDSQI